MPVDIWAVGMLTLQLFVGNQEIQRPEDWPPLSLRDVQVFLSTTFRIPGLLEKISSTGEEFVRSCIWYDSHTRLTAADARKHPWFMKPEEDRVQINEALKVARSSWSPREIVLPAIKNLQQKFAEDCMAEATKIPRPDTGKESFLVAKKAHPTSMPLVLVTKPTASSSTDDCDIAPSTGHS